MLRASPASGSSSISEIIPHSRPTLGGEEEAALSEVLTSGQIACGPNVCALEAAAATYFGNPDAVATGSGSQALLLALKSLGAGPGKRVAIPAFTCSAVLHAVEWSGSQPVLLDNWEGELAPRPASVEHVSGDVDAVIVVHPWGYPLDASIWIGSAPVVIEDCAQSIGAAWNGEPVGSTGDAAVVSFYATKMLCAGEGGLLSARRDEVNDLAGDLRDYDGKEEWALRFNFKMSDLQAALARVQWSRLPEFLEIRRQLARRYDSEVPSLGLTPVTVAGGAEPSFYRYLCWCPGDASPLLDYCEGRGVHCRRPVPVTLDRLLKLPPLPNAGEAWRRLISLPIYPNLCEDELSRVLEVLKDASEKGLIG